MGVQPGQAYHCTTIGPKEARMPDVWLPGAEHHDGSSWGSSNPYLDGPPKAILHTTESDRGSTSGNLAWAKSQGYGPHIWWDPYTGEITQSLPTTTPATAVADPRSIGLNRAGRVVIQIECIGRAAQAPLATSPLKGLDRIRDFLRGHGIAEVWPAGAPKGAVDSGRGVYSTHAKSGWYGHSQIPDNSHVDPGRVDVGKLFGQEDDVTKEELRDVIDNALEKFAPVLVRETKQAILNADLNPKDEDIELRVRAALRKAADKGQ